jgi:hypothetical protein
MSGNEAPPTRGLAGPAQYPLAKLTLHGPDLSIATKVVVSVFLSDTKEPNHQQRWCAGAADVREDPAIAGELAAFLKRHGVRSLAFGDEIVGCPHEEGQDYPAGEPCPYCPYWRNRPPGSSGNR